jgi:molybdate transport system ATP-binding protein
MFINLSFQKRLFTAHGEMDLAIDLSAKKGEIITLFGKSGAGKTTLLKLIAGLLSPVSGNLSVDSVEWYNSEKNVNLKPQQRSTGFVFQDYALFPNMTVKQNLLYADKNKEKVDLLLDMMGLYGLKDRKPQNLSGGQQQRVALARALVKDPLILLLDEPLAALDIEMRNELQDEILKINKELGVTIILISHDLAEIFKLSDKVYVIDQGKVINSGPPQQIFTHESFSAKFQFIGEILSIQKSDCIFIVNVLIGNNVIKVVVTADEAIKYEIGEKVIVGSKAFNPVMQKLPHEKVGKRIKNIWFSKAQKTD